MNNIVVIVGAVLADAVRRKVVWVVALFAGLLAVAIPALPSYGVGVAAAVYREVAIALMYAAALAVGLSLAAPRIPSEVERRTVFTVLARDIARWQYVVATWAGIVAVIGVAIAVYTVAAVAIGVVTYGETMLVLLQGSLAVWLEAAVITAVTVLLSTRFGPVTNVLGALVFAFVGHSVSGLIAPAEGATAPWWVPSLDLFNVIGPVAHGSGYSAVYALAMVGAFVGWCVALLWAASAVFSGRDL